jgi:hypothetical protein
MTKPKIQIGEIKREMTDAEYKQWQADKIEAETQAAALEAKAAARQAVLDKLGLTADEAAALFGYDKQKN